MSKKKRVSLNPSKKWVRKNGKTRHPDCRDFVRAKKQVIAEFEWFLEDPRKVGKLDEKTETQRVHFSATHIKKTIHIFKKRPKERNFTNINLVKNDFEFVTTNLKERTI